MDTEAETTPFNFSIARLIMKGQLGQSIFSILMEVVVWSAFEAIEKDKNIDNRVYVNNFTMILLIRLTTQKIV